MIRAVGLKKTYGRKEAVRGVDLDVRPGTLYGFLGPNGAGKTTIKMLTGLLHPTSGTAEVTGIDVVKDPLGEKRSIARRGACQHLGLSVLPGSLAPRVRRAVFASGSGASRILGMVSRFVRRLVYGGTRFEGHDATNRVPC